MCTKKCAKLAWVQRNSMAADVKPMPDAQAIYGLIRNTETYEIRILLYKQPPNCAHTIGGPIQCVVSYRDQCAH